MRSWAIAPLVFSVRVLRKAMRPLIWIWKQAAQRLRAGGFVRNRQQAIRQWATTTVEKQGSGNGGGPILIFNASGHKEEVSYFSLTTLVIATSLRLGGEDVRYLYCRAGLSRCNIPFGQPSFGGAPPCAACIKTSDALFPGPGAEPYGPGGVRNEKLRRELSSLDLQALSDFTYRGYPVGRLCLPSTRWAVRIHNLPETPEVQDLQREYVASSAELIDYLEEYLARIRPKAVLAFNGVFYSEAIVRAVAGRLGIRFVSFEVGFRKMNSLFMTEGAAAEMLLDIPSDYTLNEHELGLVRNHIALRFRGHVFLGGRSFWEKIAAIDAGTRTRMSDYRQVVTIFTNVVFDTSQAGVNTVFADMFDWLRSTLAVAPQYPETLFIVRIHPEEVRKSRPTREPVHDWLIAEGLAGLANVLIVAAGDSTSSYELMDGSKFCIVYNSTVGVESTLRGIPVLSGAASKYSNQGFTHLPGDRSAYMNLLQEFLSTSGAVPLDKEWAGRAERYMFFLVFMNSLDLSRFVRLTESGYTLTPLVTEDVRAENCVEMQIIRDGIVSGKPFRYRNVKEAIRNSKR